MAIRDTKPAKEIKTDGFAPEKVMQLSHDDKEKMKRHDEWHNKDMQLAASLRANWGKIVDQEHRLN
jgi:hypothetical protein